MRKGMRPAIWKERQDALRQGRGDAFFLDLSDEKCPMIFVKTRLLLEDMEQGEIGHIRFSGRDDLESVRRALTDEGLKILSLTEGADQAWQMRFKIMDATDK